jgi:anti-anti-sigma factor
LRASRVEIEMSSENPSFAIEERPSTGGRRLALSGAMGASDASLLQSVIARICDGRRTRVVLDLRALTSIDSVGMHCLAAAFDTAQEHGHELELVPGSRIGDVHELTEVLAGLPLHAPGDGHVDGMSL